jgi:hypothetical protein
VIVTKDFHSDDFRYSVDAEISNPAGFHVLSFSSPIQHIERSQWVMRFIWYQFSVMGRLLPRSMDFPLLLEAAC